MYSHASGHIIDTTVWVEWDIYVQCGRHISSAAYANNVKFMYTNASGHIIDCIEIYLSIYLSIHPSMLHYHNVIMLS